eukprot:scaffold187_cov329-Pavlova_lutheri.AAC.10
MRGHQDEVLDYAVVRNIQPFLPLDYSKAASCAAVLTTDSSHAGKLAPATAALHPDLSASAGQTACIQLHKRLAWYPCDDEIQGG